MLEAEGNVIESVICGDIRGKENKKKI